MQAQMLAPAAVLVAWTLVMLVWTAVTRFPAMRRAGIDLKNAARGGRGQNLEGVIDERANWKSHNYSHLLEQPTLFYATALTLALLEQGDALTVGLAWAYVGLRIAHSLIQALVNVIIVRFSVFMIASGVLVVLAARAAMVVFSI